MTSVAIAIEILKANPEAGSIILLAVYLGYEIRFGRLNDVQEEQKNASQERKILGIAMYKVVKDDPEFDEKEFRDLLWGDNGKVFPKDLSAEERFNNQGN